MQSFKKNPFFTAWDPLSLELYVECQLWENGETGEAKLKMSGICVGRRPSFFTISIRLMALYRRGQFSPAIADHWRRGMFYRQSTSELL